MINREPRRAVMRRREFIKLLGGAAATWPLAAHAQQPAIPVIGYLDSRSPDAAENRLRGFRQGLKDAGYIEGENITIVYRWADDRVERLPLLAAELVSRSVAAIVTAGVPTAFAGGNDDHTDSLYSRERSGTTWFGWEPLATRWQPNGNQRFHFRVGCKATGSAP